MFGLAKKREFLLKLVCYGVLLFALSFTNWIFICCGLALMLIVAVTLHYQSTNLILNKLDVGPNSTPSEDIHLAPILERLTQKYEIKKPTVYKTNTPSPLVLGLGDKNSGIIAYSQPFFDKLSSNEKEALLEIAIHKIESEFCKNIEFVTHLNSLLLFIGSKLDLIIAFIVGLKRNKDIQGQHYIFFSRISMVFLRVINYVYMNPKFFKQFDEITYQNNHHLSIALSKTLIYSPLEKKSINPLLCPFNFCNFPRYVYWQRHFEIQPQIETRLKNFQKSKNLMLQSLTI